MILTLRERLAAAAVSAVAAMFPTRRWAELQPAGRVRVELARRRHDALGEPPPRRAAERACRLAMVDQPSSYVVVWD